MFKLPTLLPILSTATLAALSLNACATAARPKTATDAALPATNAVACAIFTAITYAQLPAGHANDAGNAADTDETVAQIRRHNAKWREHCNL